MRYAPHYLREKVKSEELPVGSPNEIVWAWQPWGIHRDYWDKIWVDLDRRWKLQEWKRECQIRVIKGGKI
jgi:hypothetical protein